MSFSTMALEADTSKLKRNHESWLSHVVGCLDLKKSSNMADHKTIHSGMCSRDDVKESSVKVLYGDPTFIGKFDGQSSQNIADLLSDLSGNFRTGEMREEGEGVTESPSTKQDIAFEESLARQTSRSNTSDIYRLFHIPNSHESTQQSLEEFIRSARSMTIQDDTFNSNRTPEDSSMNDVKFTDAVKLSINMEASSSRLSELEEEEVGDNNIEITSVNRMEDIIPINNYIQSSPKRNEMPAQTKKADSHETLLLEDLITMGSDGMSDSLVYLREFDQCGEENKLIRSFNLDDLISSERADESNSSPRVTLQEVMANDSVGMMDDFPLLGGNLEKAPAERKSRQFQWNLKDETINKIRAGDNQQRGFCWSNESGLPPCQGPANDWFISAETPCDSQVHNTSSSDVLLKEIFIKVQKVPKRGQGMGYESTNVRQTSKGSGDLVPSMLVERSKLPRAPMVDGGFKGNQEWFESGERDITTQRRLQDIQNRLLLIGNRLNCINKKAGFVNPRREKNCESSSEDANVLFNRAMFGTRECGMKHRPSELDVQTVRTYGGGENVASFPRHVTGVDVSFEDCISLQSHISGTEFVVQKDIPIVITGQNNLRVLPCESELDMGDSVEQLKREKNTLLKELHFILNQLVQITTNISHGPMRTSLLSPARVSGKEEERCFIQECSSTSTQSSMPGEERCFLKDETTTEQYVSDMFCDHQHSQDSIDNEFVTDDGRVMRGSASPVQIHRVRRVYTSEGQSNADEDVTETGSDVQVITYTSCAEEIVESDLVYDTEPAQTFPTSCTDDMESLEPIWSNMKAGGAPPSDLPGNSEMCEQCGHEVPISDDSIKTIQLLQEIKKVQTIARKISFLKGLPSSLKLSSDDINEERDDNNYDDRAKSGRDSCEPLSGKTSAVMTVWEKPDDELTIPSTEVSLKSICVSRNSHHDKRHCKKKCHHRKKK